MLAGTLHKRVPTKLSGKIFAGIPLLCKQIAKDLFVYNLNYNYIKGAVTIMVKEKIEKEKFEFQAETK
ncbi:MAG: hypothetical protein ABS965_03805, partial [Succiniclasticum sp.]